MKSFAIGAGGPDNFFVFAVDHKVTIFLHLETVRHLSLSICVGSPGGVVCIVVDDQVAIFLHSQSEGSLALVTGVGSPYRLIIMVKNKVSVTLHDSFVLITMNLAADVLVIAEGVVITGLKFVWHIYK